MSSLYDCDITTTGIQLSFRDKGADIKNRKSVCTAQVYLDTLIMATIQGRDFFKAIEDNLDIIFAGEIKRVMGYVWRAHVDMYRKLPGCSVDVWASCQHGGEWFDWVVVERLP